MTKPTELDDFGTEALQRFRKTTKERFAKLSPEQRRELAEQLMDKLLGKPIIAPASKSAGDEQQD